MGLYTHAIKQRVLKCQHQNLGDGSMQRCHLAGTRGQVLARSSPSYIDLLKAGHGGNVNTIEISKSYKSELFKFFIWRASLQTHH